MNNSHDNENNSDLMEPEQSNIGNTEQKITYPDPDGQYEQDPQNYQDYQENLNDESAVQQNETFSEQNGAEYSNEENYTEPTITNDTVFTPIDPSSFQTQQPLDINSFVNPSKQSVKKKKPVLLFVIIGFLLIGAITASAMYFKAKAETPKKMFLNALVSEEGYQTSLGNAEIFDFYASSTHVNYAKKIMNTPLSSDLTLTADIGKGLYPAEYGAIVEKVLADLSVKINTKQDPADMRSLLNIAAALSGSNIASIELVQTSDGKIGIRSNELYPSFITADFQEVMKIINSLNYSSDAPKVSYDLAKEMQQQAVKMFDNLLRSAKRISSLLKPYLQPLDTSFTKEHFVLEKEASLEGIPNKTFNKVTLTMTGDELKTLLSTMITIAQSDTELSNFLKELYSSLYDFYSLLMDNMPSGYFDASIFPSPDNIPMLLNTGLATLSGLLSTTEMPDQVSINFYLEDMLMTNMSIIVNAPNLGVDKLSLQFKNFSDPSNVQNIICSIGISEPSMGENSISIVNNLSNNGANDRSHRLDFLFQGKMFESMNAFDIEYQLRRQGQEETFEFGFKENGSGDSYYPSVHLMNKLTEQSGGNQYTVSGEIGISDATFISSEDNNNIALHYTGDMTFGPVEIPDINTSDAIVITEASMSDGTFDNLLEELQTNIENFVYSNLMFFSKYLM